MYQDWVANDGITPAQVVNANYFKEFDTEEDPYRSHYYMTALFNFAYAYFRASDAERAQIKYTIHIVHRIAVNGIDTETERAIQSLQNPLGKTATETGRLEE
jgi:hypothetical protein